MVNASEWLACRGQQQGRDPGGRGRQAGDQSDQVRQHFRPQKLERGKPAPPAPPPYIRWRGRVSDATILESSHSVVVTAVTLIWCRKFINIGLKF